MAVPRVLAFTCVLSLILLASPLETRSAGPPVVELLILNTRIGPFNDLAARQAVASAVDRGALASVDGKQVALSLVPPVCRAHNREARLYALNPPMAQELLVKKGITPERPVGVALSVLTQTPPKRVDLLTVALKTLGIVALEVDSPSTSSTHLFYMKIGLDANLCQNSSPVKIVHSKSALNLSGYASPEVDGWIDQTDASRDAAVRMRLFQQAEQKVLDDAVLIPIWWEW